MPGKTVQPSTIARLGLETCQKSPVFFSEPPETPLFHSVFHRCGNLGEETQALLSYGLQPGVGTGNVAQEESPNPKTQIPK
jgi:hypothetical protein